MGLGLAGADRRVAVALHSSCRLSSPKAWPCSHGGTGPYGPRARCRGRLAWIQFACPPAICQPTTGDGQGTLTEPAGKLEDRKRGGARVREQS
jgi:hypothetical protein